MEPHLTFNLDFTLLVGYLVGDNQGGVMTYKVYLEKTDEGYAIHCPGLPGCWSQGATEEEALENIKDAIMTYLATVDELSKERTTRLVEVTV